MFQSRLPLMTHRLVALAETCGELEISSILVFFLYQSFSWMLLSSLIWSFGAVAPFPAIKPAPHGSPKH